MSDRVCWMAQAALALILAAPPVHPQQVESLSEAKAQYLIEITKHILWPNDADLEKFRVAVLTNDDELKDAFRERASVRVRDKQFEFDFLAGGDFDLDRYTHVFIGQRYRNLNDDLFERARKTLLMADGRVERERLMLGVTTRGLQLSLQMNRENLAARGLEPSISLLEFAGTKEDLTNQLRESQTRLSSLIAEVSAKEARVEALNRALSTNSEALKAAEAELATNRRELETARRKLADLSEQIRGAQGEVEEFRSQIEEQRTLFENKQREIAAKEQAIAQLELKIARNQEVLDRQISEIAAQRAMLAEKSQTIVEQRDVLFVVQGMLLVFFVLAFFLHRLNTQKKRANRELEELNEQLYELATTDGMTGLFNRRHFLETAQMAFVHQRRKDKETTVLMMDIDRFKEINDTHGHAAGDEVIRSVGKMLQDNLREYDIVGRLGGEEYAMMLVDCGLDRSLEIAERLCRDIAKAAIHYDDKHINVTMSIGVGKVEKDDRNIEEALVRADRAMYAAKERGRNRVVSFDTVE